MWMGEKEAGDAAITCSCSTGRAKCEATELAPGASAVTIAMDDCTAAMEDSDSS
jgi:hypothetical protein